ncbi:uncharacterized protein LOC111144534 isoform X1 [Enhydra lutris kenyoni]|uniref:Uncharacterized protein LOC111144534 isoform X1 n=1 Tax=Enhydra lutris kenyoni TaxID=391180 RepID=A0A2Y9J0V6_ENHLU|nr:uncharacterized protein LOC111144534 isoform X1 [Enhydra lutris kenyoni]
MPSTDRDREDVVHGRSGGGLRHQKGRSPAVCIDTGPGEVGQFWTRLVVFCERCPSQGARLLGSSVWPRGIPVMARELVFCVSGGRTCWDMVSLCVEVQDSFWEWTHQLLSPPTAVRLQAPPGPGPCRPVSLEPFWIINWFVALKSVSHQGSDPAFTSATWSPSLSLSFVFPGERVFCLAVRMFLSYKAQAPIASGPVVGRASCPPGRGKTGLIVSRRSLGPLESLLPHGVWRTDLISPLSTQRAGCPSTVCYSVRLGCTDRRGHLSVHAGLLLRSIQLLS